jgi:FkbM family methyltransferase
MASPLTRATNFVSKPWPSQFRSFAFRWIRTTSVPLPFRLPFKSWWLLRNNQISAYLLNGNYEDATSQFVQRYLQPGMVMLDIGANQGFFSLMASRLIGASGRIVAFEPSPRDRGYLKQHLRLNRCHNVEMVACALGESDGTADLHVVDGTETGCNSLRPPDIAQPTRVVTVPVRRLDDVLRSSGVAKVDFIKIDVEGAELSVLQGATELLTRSPRPVILAEAEDIRTKPWGYRAADILSKLTTHNYVCFEPQPSGQLKPIPDPETFQGNLVAVPNERLDSLRQHLLS